MTGGLSDVERSPGGGTVLRPGGRGARFASRDGRGRAHTHAVSHALTPAAHATPRRRAEHQTAHTARANGEEFVLAPFPMQQARPTGRGHGQRSHRAVRLAIAFAFIAPFGVLPVPFAAPQQAMAQVGSGLGSDVSGSLSISSAQQREIEAFARPQLEALGSGEPGRIRAARERLLEPLRARQVSIAFREAYEGVLFDALSTHIRQDDRAAAFASMWLCAELATQRPINLLRDTLEQPGSAERAYFAAVCLERLFTVLDDTGGGIQPELAARLPEVLGSYVREAETWREADAGVRALARATAMSPTPVDFASTRNAAVSALADATGARVRALDPADEPELIRGELMLAFRAAVQLRTTVTDTRNPPARDSIVSAAGFAGDVLAYALAVVNDGLEPDDDADRDLLNDLIGEGQIIVIFAGQQLGEELDQADLSEGVSGRRFVTEAARLLSALSRPPFRLEATRFDPATRSDD